MNDLYEVLEVCLQDIEQGADIETVLFRYPELADELRPILEGSLNARSMAIVAPSAEVVRRNRAKVLQHAAQLREAKAKPSSRRIWFASLRRVAVTLVVVAALFVSGTGLVSAASATLPGDNLYPVKRTWEDLLLLFTFNLQQREALEIEHENERLHELRELFADGRSVEVEFSGLVTNQNGNEWVVAGIRVVISAQTEVRDGPVIVGSAVRVKGWTNSDGSISAERVRLLPPGAKLPEFEIEEEGHDDNSGKGSEGEGPKIEETETPESESGSNDNSSNSGSGSDNSGPGSNDNGNENDGSSVDNSGSDHDSNSNDDNSNDGDSGDSNDNSGHGSDDSGGSDGSDDSGGGDNSGSGGGDGGGGDDGGGGGGDSGGDD
ncbi:MAG: hypothetical protein EHM33_31820 [Chloroflexi bacterium]|nr:MAG: hypothetical protein EHM33_31820 [Chloroflexota bacterium]